MEANCISVPITLGKDEMENEKNLLQVKTVAGKSIGTVLRIVQLLGSGGQGHVYEIETESGESYALKIYSDDCKSESFELRKKKITKLTRIGCDNNCFLWPISVLIVDTREAQSLGYLMQLKPDSFCSASLYLNQEIDLEYDTLIRACHSLCDAFSWLHVQGLYYADISLNNFFLNPISGEVLICDIDNIAYQGDKSMVVGTQEFMAPEVVEGKTLPSIESDNHSLAVLLFKLLYKDHPLNGRTEDEIAILDDDSRRALYGSNAVYIYHPTDDRNRPVEGVHDAAILFDRIYPKGIKQVFERAFAIGLHNPGKRPGAMDWSVALQELYAQMGHCHQCGQTIFHQSVMNEQASICWNCGSNSKPLVINYDDQRLIVSIGLAVRKNGQVVAKIVRNPNDEAVLGLKNMTQTYLAISSVNQDGWYKLDPQHVHRLKRGLLIQSRDLMIKVE